MSRMFAGGPPGGDAQKLLEEVSKGLDVWRKQDDHKHFFFPFQLAL